VQLAISGQRHQHTMHMGQSGWAAIGIVQRIVASENWYLLNWSQTAINKIAVYSNIPANMAVVIRSVSSVCLSVCMCVSVYLSVLFAL